MEKRLAAGQYYITQDIFIADLRRMFANCRYVRNFIIVFRKLIIRNIIYNILPSSTMIVSHFRFLLLRRTYNAPETVYYKCADQLDKYVDELFHLPPAKKRPVD
jgi:hypothetical protein